MSFERDIDRAVETLRNAQRWENCGCTILIGAGCSVRAGVPTAQGFVDIIKESFPNAYERASYKTYPKCMAELSVGERQRLIAEKVDKAQINWAHIAIAQLMKAGYVDRVLTTNFDMLVVRACSLVGIQPAIYDFASSQLFKPAEIPSPSVFYLHGQRTGFVLMNTEEEIKKHTELLEPVFSDTGHGRSWIVVGYSGDNDPVFDHLAKVERFDYNLYWVGYKDNEPSGHVREKLLEASKYAYYIKGYDADRFFIELAVKLDCFPPKIFSDPYVHLLNCFNTVCDYPLGKDDSGDKDILQAAKREINLAIENQENLKLKLETSKIIDEDLVNTLEIAASTLFMEEKYDEVLKLGEKLGDKASSRMKEILGWSYFNLGGKLLEKAKTKTGNEALQLLEKAAEMYNAVLKIKMDFHEALTNWGVALFEQAKTKSGEEADNLFELAGEKYEAVLKIKPDFHEALFNWGLALSEQATTKSSEEADRLFKLAGEKYEAVLKIKPDFHEALFNWGFTLSEQAKTKSGEEADGLFKLAGEKYEAVLKLKPDFHKALNNWGNTLSEQAKTKSGEEADGLFELAGEKYESALKIKPDDHEALTNWGIALYEQAKTKSGEEADGLFELAGEKYEEVLKLKQDDHIALNNWGNSLSGQAQNKSGDESKNLFADAFEKCLKAESIKPGSGSYNLACISALQGKSDDCRKWLNNWQKYGELPDKKHIETDNDLDSIRNEEWFKKLLEKL